MKAMVFPVVMYGCESRTVKKAECRRIDAFELWCWRRLLRVPWTARRSNQSILKAISPGCILEGMMLKLKLQYFGHLILCRPLLLLPPIPPSITVFSNESALRMRGPKCWSFSFSSVYSSCRTLEHTFPIHDHSLYSCWTVSLMARQKSLLLNKGQAHGRL